MLLEQSRTNNSMLEITEFCFISKVNQFGDLMTDETVGRTPDMSHRNSMNRLLSSFGFRE